VVSWEAAPADARQLERVRRSLYLTAACASDGRPPASHAPNLGPPVGRLTAGCVFSQRGANVFLNLPSDTLPLSVLFDPRRRMLIALLDPDAS